MTDRRWFRQTQVNVNGFEKMIGDLVKVGNGPDLECDAADLVSKVVESSVDANVHVRHEFTAFLCIAGCFCLIDPLPDLHRACAVLHGV